MVTTSRTRRLRRVGITTPTTRMPPERTETTIVGEAEAEVEQPAAVRMRKKRGPSHAADVWTLEEGFRIEVKFNKYGQAVGPARHILADFLGSVARKGNLCPLHYHDWRKVPNKEDIIAIIKGKFTIPENNYRVERFLNQSIGSKWRGHKHNLRKQFFVEGSPIGEIISKKPENVVEAQWKDLVLHWATEKSKRASRLGKNARSRMNTPHTAGSRSFAELNDQFHEEHNRSPSRLEAFALQHKHKDGRFVNELAQQIIEQGENRVADRIANTETEVENHVALQNEVYDDLVGLDRYGRVRGFGLGVVQKDLTGVHASFGMSQEAEDKLKQMEAQIAGMRDSIRAEVRAELEAEFQVDRRSNIGPGDRAAIRQEVRDEVVAEVNGQMQDAVNRTVASMLSIYGIGPSATTSK